jgi:hypothetical protein
MSEQKPHPAWCCRPQCTAYHDVERRDHRSMPAIIPTADPYMTWYVHVGASPDGSNPYLEITELELPVRGAWWHPISAATELVMPLDQAEQLRNVLNDLLGTSATA